MMSNKSKIISSKNYSWKGVEKKEYKTDTNNFKGVHRYSLLDDDLPDLNSHTRYFEVEAGGYSSLEHHRHPHSVVIIRGSGTVILDDELQNIGLHDVVYIAPGTIHQFHADNEEPLGFLCIVDRYRDRPKIPDDQLITERITSEKTLKKIQK